MNSLEFERDAKLLKEKVKSAINLKLADFPFNLSYELKRTCVLSGSSISSLWWGETPKDFDLWCKEPFDPAERKSLIVQSYIKHIATYNEKYTDSDALTINIEGATSTNALITANAITFKNDVQFITIDKYEYCRKHFDFVHCKPYYDIDADKLYISMEQLDAIQQKKLVLAEGGKSPLDKRIEKFTARGWRS